MPNDFYAPPNPRARSAAEAYQDACVEQSKVMSSLATQLREALDALAPVEHYGVRSANDVGVVAPDVARAALVKIASVERCLTAIAFGLRTPTP